MKKYSAIVKREDGSIVMIRNQMYGSKKEFMYDLRRNGYKVNTKKVKESELFDYILNNTDCNSWDWQMRIIPEH